MTERFIPSQDDNLNPLSVNPEVDEQQDNSSEESFLSNLNLQEYVSAALDRVSGGYDALSYDEAFKNELRRTLNELITTFIRNNVNALRLEDNEFHNLKLELHESVSLFIDTLNQNIGYGRDISDVIETKVALDTLFTRHYESRVLEESAEESFIDYNIEISEFDSGGIHSLHFMPRSVSDEEGEVVSTESQVSFCNLEGLDSDSAYEGDLSSRIRENMSLFTMSQVNPEIGDVAKFERIVFGDLTSEQIREFTVSDSVNYVFNLLKRKLNLPQGEDLFKLDSMDADSMSVESLLNGDAPVCCRHIVYLFKIVSDAIRTRQESLFTESEDAPLHGVTYMPVTDRSLAHATLAISKGDSISNIEPTWSIQNSEDSVMDATFSEKHGTSVLPILNQLQMRGEGFDQIVGSSIRDQFVTFLSTNLLSNKSVGLLTSAAAKQIVYTGLQNMLELEDLNSVSFEEQNFLCSYLVGAAQQIMVGVSELDYHLHKSIFESLQEFLQMEGLDSELKMRLEILVLPVYKAITQTPVSLLYVQSSNYLHKVDVNVLNELYSEYNSDQSDKVKKYNFENYLKLSVLNFETACTLFQSLNNMPKVDPVICKSLLSRSKILIDMLGAFPDNTNLSDKKKNLEKLRDYLKAQSSVS
jgi:hypothetical protein